MEQSFINASHGLLVVIPTYNEIENIKAIIEAVLSLEVGAHVLIVDDNSPDGTAAAVKEMQQAHEGRVFLLQRAGKQGLGSAYIAGFTWGLSHDYRYICEMDADFSHDPNDVPRLLEACERHGADVAIGSRYSNGFRVKNWPWHRILLSYCASLYVRVVTCMPIKDTTAGFVCYRAEALREILGYEIRMNGYGFQIEMKYYAHRLGFTIEEVPIYFTDRLRGKSKMSGGIFSEALWGVLRMRMKCSVPKRRK